MDNHQIDQLLDKYLAGNCTVKEQLRVEQWLDKAEHGSGVWFDFTQEHKASYISKIKTRLQESIRTEKAIVVPLYKRRTFTYLAAACVALMVCTLGVIFYNRYDSINYNSSVTANRDIAPGKNTATLTLSDGRKVVLSNEANGQFANDSEVSISKTADGQLIYTLRHADKGRGPRNESLNTLETANGQQYIVILPDGSKVHLNAASSLKYPVSFARLKQRKVELKGEAYFEVSKDKQHPFIVVTNKQKIEVLGTHFNVNSYVDEVNVKTTLLEGSVRVMVLQTANQLGQDQHDTVLKPGEQAVLTNGSLKIQQADIENEIAWTAGDFFFKEEPLESVMRKIARWYNVSVEFAPDLPKNIRLSGRISRERTISAVLERMGRTGNIHFDIEGKRVTVSPQN